MLTYKYPVRLTERKFYLTGRIIDQKKIFRESEFLNITIFQDDNGTVYTLLIPCTNMELIFSCYIQKGKHCLIGVKEYRSFIDKYELIWLLKDAK